jgi:hypothetical protein
VDFGYRFAGNNTITGTVWHDSNSGGQVGGIGDINITETIRYGNVTVYLWNCQSGTCNDGDEILVGTTTTDVNGNYTFSNLAGNNITPQTYAVVVNSNATNLIGTTATPPPAYDGIPGTDPSVTFNSPGGGASAQRDFGFVSTMDLGDLPGVYNNTVLNDNGARHRIPVSGAVYLGSLQDADPNGQESDSAGGPADGGDDNDGSDDDDGVDRSGGAWNSADGGEVTIDASSCITTC